jgi:cytochrome P450
MTAVTATDAPLAWDPLDEQYKDDPHTIWKRLRDEAPLYYNEQLDFYALSRFSDVDGAHRDPHTFSSAHGTVLEMMSTGSHPTAPPGLKGLHPTADGCPRR